MVKLKTNWEDFALCKKDNDAGKWLSLDINDINYAKNICRKCTVRNECMISALSQKEYIGVNGGVSEYEFLTMTWVEARKIEENNWPRTDRVIHELFKTIA
jgi:hypothetical protein